MVAIPSNRVNVSYLEFKKSNSVSKNIKVAIPSNRVNVSYEVEASNIDYNDDSVEVAIPSNRVNVSYYENKGKT